MFDLKKVIWILIGAAGIGLAISRCPECKEQIRQKMMDKMSKKMPEMMEKCLASLSPDERAAMLTECKKTLNEMEAKVLED